ncbi:GGDEF domain-containing protein [Pseudomonas sp. 5P_3.1_Bac2]|uniref:GGDEF domain-containing protein n=1 Tax=Pseudomonas sp. 5P_3.1_Bac2 TaxID=2971617 RepID=UPI0021C71EC8|nr:GGDEF domain-containing protein [Pseudomonas sp. 5P_3.1_Bac2]MCU1719417.1 GGDEF domain-containing protein [Pseudomonas sp. 5P_3.1_Bac2]
MNKSSLFNPGHKYGRLGWLTECLLLIVIALAIATLFALRITQQEMHALAQPHQLSDRWHITNATLGLYDLGHAARTTQQQPRPDNAYDDLRIKLDVAASMLNPGEFNNNFMQMLSSSQPDTKQVLTDLNQRLVAWSEALLGGADAGPIARQITEQVDDMTEQMRQIVLAVHIATVMEQDQMRLNLHDKFALLNWILCALLAGIILLVVKLIKDRQVMKRLFKHMHSLNKRLEGRVERRTRQLAESKALLMFILDASPSEAALVNADTGDVLFINKTMLDRLELQVAPDQLFLKDLLADPQKGLEFIDEVETYGRVDNWEALLMPHKPYWCSVSVKLVEIEGKLAHLLWGFDITEHRKLMHLLEQQANTDALTQLYNRRAFYQLGGQVLDSCKRYGHPCSLLMVDIDLFKQINDAYGHAAGDLAICSLSQTLRASLRDADIIGRMGGEEFAVLMPHTDLQQALESAERLRRAVEEKTISAEQHQVRMSISIGVAVFDADRLATLELMLLNADKALYRAKIAGRNRVEIL